MTRFVKGYRFLSFAKIMDKNIGKNINKNLSGKYSPGMLACAVKVYDRLRQQLLDHTNHLQQMDLKLLQKEQVTKQQKQLVI